MPMPRKLPSRTKFEKYARKRTFEPVQRMSASSTNSIRLLSRIRRNGLGTRVSLGACAHHPYGPMVPRSASPWAATIRRR